MQFESTREDDFNVDYTQPESARESGVGLLELPEDVAPVLTVNESLLATLLAEAQATSLTVGAPRIRTTGRLLVPEPDLVPAHDEFPSALECVALGLRVAAFGAAGLTMVGMMILGPFGFLPVLFVGPLFAFGELVAWLDRRRSPGQPGPVAVPVDQPLPTACDAHLALPALLTRLELEQDPVRLARQLEHLRALLAAHFAEEESNGLFDELLTLEPRLPVDLRLKGFERDHVRILEDLAGVRACRSPAALYALRTRVVRDLRAHQQAEDALIQEVYGIYVPGTLSV